MRVFYRTKHVVDYDRVYVLITYKHKDGSFSRRKVHIRQKVKR